jgi:hypothetical protein
VAFKKKNYKLFLQFFFIFLLAFAIRFFFGYATFGSIDIVNFKNYGAEAVAGSNLLPMPYFPFIYFLVTFSEFISRYFLLPFAICYKVVAIFFDSLIAVLIFQVGNLKKIEIKKNSLITLIYIFCPVSILITSIHGQFEAIVIFFLILILIIREYYKPNYKINFVTGGLIAFATIVKPYAIFFIYFAFPRTEISNFKDIYKFEILKHIKKFFFFAIGFLSVGFFFFIIFYLYDFDIIQNYRHVKNYALGAARPLIFGASFSDYFKTIVTFKYTVILTLYFFIILLDVTKKIDSFTSVAILFLVLLASNGIAPQYLIWPVTFIILSSAFEVFFFYNLFVTLLLLIYYLNPSLSYGAFENMGTFASIKTLSWISPNYQIIDFFILFKNIFQILSSTIMPIFFFLSIIYLFVMGLKKKNIVSSDRFLVNKYIFNKFLSYLLLFILILIILSELLLSFQLSYVKNLDYFSFDSNYNVVQESDTRFWIGDYSKGSWYSAPIILIVISIINFLFFFLNSNANKPQNERKFLL